MPRGLPLAIHEAYLYTVHMKQYRIDVALLHSEDSTYKHLASVFHFPSYFGKNLDALHDCLDDLIRKEGAITVTWTHNTSDNQSEMYQSIRSLMAENKDIIFVE